MKVSVYNQYLWLINTIYSAGQITLPELDEKWAHSNYNLKGENHYGARRFLRHRDDIVDLFGIVIECDKRTGNVYYIANKEVMKEDHLRKWLLNSFAVHAILHESEPLRHRILFEDIPSGHMYLLPIIEAMRDNRKMGMSYQAYSRNEATTLEFSPYCLKVFKQRWYVVGFSSAHQSVRIFALDRILSLAAMDDTFNLPKDFVADNYFRGYFGVIRDIDTKPQTIRIKVEAMTANYLRSLPLHSSQKEIEHTEKYAVFEYMVAPTYDFIQELRMQGANLEVLAPADLRELFKQEAKKAFNNYQ